MIEFLDVDFSYDGQKVFSGLSFHLEHGKYMVISGPARSGKTTLIQLIAGLFQPNDGEIFIEGEPLSRLVASRRRLREVRRKIGGVGGVYKLLSDRTILENIALAAEIGGLPAKAARKCAMEAAGRYHLSPVARNYPDAVSEVERRAALLARAEAARKNLVVADAPTDGLDQKSARFINERLAALHLAGATILYLTTGSGPQIGPDQYLQFINGKVAP